MRRWLNKSMKRIIFYFFVLLLPSNAWASSLFKDAAPVKVDEPVIAKNPDKSKSPAVFEGDEISFLRSEGKAFGKGHVKVTYQDVQIFCNQMEYDQDTNVVNVAGNVRIVRAPTKTAPSGSILYGKAAVYNLDSKSGQMKDIKIEAKPFYDHAKEGYLEDGRYVLINGYVSTCDLDDPHYRLTARKIIIYPKDKIVAKNVWLKVGPVPVFYIPYYSQSLKDKFPVELAFGHKKYLGMYVLTGWRYKINEQNRGKIHLDWYEDRGEGFGITHNAETSDFGKALVNAYFIKDAFYSQAKADVFAKDYPERLVIPPKYLQEDRYKAQISYKWNPMPKLAITADVNKFSDENFMKDFFYREYQTNPTQNSYILADYSFANSSLAMLTQGHANNFYTEKEYLPQLNYNLYRQQLGQSQVYFQSNELLGDISQRYAYSPLKYDSNRFYSSNTISRPFQIKWLHIDNSLSQTSAYYSKDTQGQGAWSTSWQAGATASVKLYKTLPYQFNLLGQKIEAMRQILTPSIGYAYIRAPIGNFASIVPFDDLMNIARSELVSIGFDNKFQVKTKTDKWDFIYFNPTAYYHIGDRGLENYFSNIYSKLEIYPVPNKGLVSEYNYDLRLKRLTIVNGDLSFSGKKYSVAFGQRYTRTQPAQSTLNLSYQLTPKIKYLGYMIYDDSDGYCQEQEYGFRFDLHCWWMDIDFDIKHPQANKVRDTGIWIQFSLKGFESKTHLIFDHTFSNANKYSGQ
jgi:lipopolysaccharide assembly outer membrane protein LptD (OstA)